jgi:hypothetical protein
LLIKISSDVIAALESEPRWKDKAADRAALLLMPDVASEGYTKRCRRLDHSTPRLSRLPALW